MSKYFSETTKKYVNTSPYNNSGDINQRVEAIITERSRHEEKLTEARRRLNEMNNALRNFNTVRQNAFPSVEKITEFFNGDSTKAVGFWEKLQQINGQYLTELGEQCVSIAKDIQNASRRFHRNHISIAIVGESRQGKSTLIQRITGLDDMSVPTSAGDICTAARSRIVNGRSQKAKITFFGRDEFFHDVIAPYFVHAGVIPESDRFTVNDFAYAEELYARIGDHGPDIYIQKLEEYLNLDKRASYENYLDEDPIELDDFSELREYMAQRNQLNTPYASCKYLAVKDVEITTPFAQASSAERLMIFDTIGVSEPTLGVKEQMFNTISEEADFVLYVSRLSTDSSKWIYGSNVKLYYDMLKRLKGVPAYRWIFWVLNHETESNYNAALGGLEGTFNTNFDHIIDNINAQGGDTSMYMPAGVLSVNCNDEADVGRNLVSPLISHLAANLGAIDEALIETINQRIVALESKFSKLRPLLQGLKLPERNTTAIRNRLKALAMNTMVNKLNDRVPAFLDQYCPESLISEWRENVRLVIQNLDDKIPTEDAIDKLYAKHQNNALMTIYQSYQLARKQLEESFNGEQFHFDGMVFEVKKELMKLFMECSGLKDLIPPVDYESPNIVPAIAQILFGEYGADCEVLESSFEHIHKFSVVQGSLLANWIREKTESLNTNLGNGNIPQYWANIGLYKAIITKLQSLVGEIRESLNHEVDQLASPVQQIRVTVFGFVTSISNLGGDYSVAWQNVFEPYVERMYPEEFKGIALFNSRISTWNKSIDSLIDYQPISIQFIV